MIEIKSNKEVVVEFPSYELKIGDDATVEVNGKSITLQRGSKMLYNSDTRGYEIIGAENGSKSDDV